MEPNLIHLEEIGSTNAFLKEKAQEGAPSWTAVVADSQSHGSGKRGRDFFSPKGTGLYCSVLLRDFPLGQDSLRLTSMVALAAAQAIETVFYVSPAIKWVNDLYLNQKKVGGILTEAITSSQSNVLDTVIVGLGVNLFPPSPGFPKELEGVAGSLLKTRPSTAGAFEMRDRLADSFLENLNSVLDCKDSTRLLNLYRERSFLLGKKVMLSDEDDTIFGVATGINEKGYLLLKTDTGQLISVHRGDITLLD